MRQAGEEAGRGGTGLVKGLGFRLDTPGRAERQKRSQKTGKKRRGRGEVEEKEKEARARV